MTPYVLRFDKIDKASLASVGGKGANLGELFQVPGINVPSGFCVTTRAFSEFLNTTEEFQVLLKTLDSMDVESLEEIKAAGSRIRSCLENQAIPEIIRREVIQAWQEAGNQYAYAVRSSATAEDLPGASFAGQQDTYLNIKGEENILESVRKCWASLFTDRAIIYRKQNGFEHDKVLLSVVVQRMVFPEVSGIAFTADPVTGNRKVVSIDASYGLGEALVSGLVSADLYQVVADNLIKKQIAKKQLAIYANPEGGTAKTEVAEAMQTAQALKDEEAIRLARMGRVIEKHFGSPQDIEWGIADQEIFILQSRPITTLYPAPGVNDEKVHLFMSFGHPQMMTEAMKPLGISVLRTVVPFGKSSPAAESIYLREAGSRLYLDITTVLAYRQARKVLPAWLRNVDEMISRAVEEFITREEFLKALQPAKAPDVSLLTKVFPMALEVFKNIVFRDDDQAIEKVNALIAGSVAKTRDELQQVSGADRIARIQEILANLMPSVFMAVFQYMGAALLTYKRIESLSRKWLGDTAELGSISKSPEGNVTTEMGLMLGDLADAARNYPAVVEYLRHATDEAFWEGLSAVAGGEEVLPVFRQFFARYGMRGTGEIDITRPRWREVPTQPLASILSHINSSSPGQHRREFQAGKEEAERAAARLLERLRHTSGGYFKTRRMQRLIKVYRSFIGIREHPKYFLVQSLDLVKLAIREEAAKLVETGILGCEEDVFWFSLPEIKKIIETHDLDPAILAVRREKFLRDAKLTPPRVITSEGEIITAKPSVEAPPGALAGSPVSAGRVEGRARVIRKLEEAKMEKGDILVAPYTDPAWTPLFPLAAGLVTEVGGLMTHGAVVAREYGIPAVVGVENATALIKDGQRIRVNGTEGYVEISE